MKSLDEVLKTWEPVIGLEVHAQLKTTTKAFCRCRATYGEEVNTVVCPVCMGYPGTLPVVNREMVTYAVAMGLATGSTIHERTRFARKNYFYPDLPKGYQITQYETPICTRGWIPLDIHGRKAVGLTRIHMEEDAGKSMHTESGTLVDYNRCGVPLIEIVSEPDMRHPSEAYAYLTQIRRIVRYLGICDGNMEEGSLRCDANVSIRPIGQREFGVKVEMKNLNSIKGVERAITYEIQRQAEVLEAGGTIWQETRLWDEGARMTRPMRSKEASHDYRYFPEPDLVPLVVDQEWIGEVEKTLPELAHHKAKRYHYEMGIGAEESEALVGEQDIAQYFEEMLTRPGTPPSSLPVHGGDSYSLAPKVAANWVLGEVLRVLKETNGSITEFPVRSDRLADLARLAATKKVTSTGAKDIFNAMLTDASAPSDLMKKMGLEQTDNADEIEQIARQVIEMFPNEVEIYRNGKPNLIGMFMGQAMKLSRGKANPTAMTEKLKELLGPVADKG